MEGSQTIPYLDIVEKAQGLFSDGNAEMSLKLLNDLESDHYDDLSLLVKMKLTSLKGIIYLNRGEIKQAEEYALRSLERAKEYGDPISLYKRYDNLAAIYMNIKNYHLAHDYMQRSIELKESTAIEKDLIPGLLQLASLFFQIDNLEAGKKTMTRAAEIMAEYPVNDQSEMHYNFLLGMQNRREKKYDIAIAKYEKAAEIARKVSYHHVEARAYLNQGEVYKEQEKWKEAESKLNQALEVSIQNSFGIDELNIRILLALVAIKQGHIDECRQLYEDVRNKSRNSADGVLLKDLEEVGALMYEAEGKYPEALKAFKSHMGYYKKQYDSELSRNIVNIQAKYEAEKSERQLKESRLLQVESELKALQAEHILQEREKRFKTLIENSTDGIVIVDANRTPIYMSPYVSKILGYDPKEMIGIDIFPIVHPDDQALIGETTLSLLAHPGIPFHGQFRFPRKNGEYIWIEGTAINLFDDEAVNGVVCNFRDISERKESEAAIHDLNRSLETIIADRTSELKEVVKDLEAFSYSVSHDLRSPLRIISGYAKLLMADHGEKMDEEAKEFVETILENTKRMGQLIDDLLNFSRLGRKALFKSDLDMTGIVEGVLLDLQKASDSVPQSIVIHDLRPSFADHALIKQVWFNLISNAMKYSAKKSNPEIEIGDYEDNGKVVYYVKDNGAGFDMRFAHNLFGVFKRLHDRSDFEGIGVGLALAHRIIRMHEGRIWAEAEVEKGATFYFTLGE